MMKAKEICSKSGIKCVDFAAKNDISHLPNNLKIIPQHIIVGKKVYLLYFKGINDERFLLLKYDEINSLRKWNSYINPLIIMVYNYITKRYTILDIETIDNLIFKERREKKGYLLRNDNFKWNYDCIKFSV